MAPTARRVVSQDMGRLDQGLLFALRRDPWVRHAIGLMFLLRWRARLLKTHAFPPLSSLVVEVPSTAAGRFLLGFPQQRCYGMEPFLACQKEEAAWLNLVPWEQATLSRREGSDFLLLQAPPTPSGSHSRRIDLSAIVVALPLQNPEVADVLGKNEGLAFRKLSVEPSGALEVAKGRPLFSLDILDRRAAPQPWVPEAWGRYQASLNLMVTKLLAAECPAETPSYLGGLPPIDKEFLALLPKGTAERARR